MATAANLELITALENLRLSVYIDTASCALFVYDYMLTFEDERTLVWPQKWTLLKALFFMVRYFPIVDVTITALSQFMTDLSPEVCSFEFKSAAWLIGSGIVTAEFILLIRIHAIWGRGRFITIILTIWSIVNMIPGALIMGFFLKSIRFSPMPPGFSGCFVTSGNDLLIGAWSELMVYEAVIVALMVYKGVQLYNELGRTALYLALFRDGAIFYIYIFTLSVGNVIVISTLSHDKAKFGMLAGIERVTHSILTGRLILTLRKAKPQPELEEASKLEGIEFEPGPRGTVDTEAGLGTAMCVSSRQWEDDEPSNSRSCTATGSN